MQKCVCVCMQWGGNRKGLLKILQSDRTFMIVTFSLVTVKRTGLVTMYPTLLSVVDTGGLQWCQLKPTRKVRAPNSFTILRVNHQQLLLLLFYLLFI